MTEPDATMEKSAPETPTTLGEFRIIREIGRGGMGVVYEAEQTSLRQPGRLESSPVRRGGRRRGDEAVSARGGNRCPAASHQHRADFRRRLRKSRWPRR